RSTDPEQYLPSWAAVTPHPEAEFTRSIDHERAGRDFITHLAVSRHVGDLNRKIITMAVPGFCSRELSL
ncbi:MAG TPA: hypothetical protein VFU86_09955, partial [Terriglobales bacterium]|nr:hypothetical protein [Terriglobales bacterium]